MYTLILVYFFRLFLGYIYTFHVVPLRTPFTLYHPRSFVVSFHNADTPRTSHNILFLHWSYYCTGFFTERYELTDYKDKQI